VMLKYGVTHHISTAYHPQMSRHVEVSNYGLKRILKRTGGEYRTSWPDKLNDALWAFCTTFKTLIGCTPYKVVYEKACHLTIKLEHKAYWALKHCNFDLKSDKIRRARYKQQIKNDAHDADANIKPIYDEEPMAKVETTAEINVFATRQQHTEQPEFNNKGEVDQNA
nr:reverse transcriptase domain-containing protein [Tanacetum cinerariifolium]